MKALSAKFIRYLIHLFLEYINNFVAVCFKNIVVYLKDVIKGDEHV